ncbi:MAG: hypothetical protein KY463_16335, partial [Actinobacteria bacterium]|nr:hypothetical protein [Actinomycetota bacterium]
MRRLDDRGEPDARPAAVAFWLYAAAGALVAVAPPLALSSGLDDADAAVLALLWSTLGAGALADFSQGYETGFGILVVAGIVTVGAITVLLAGRFRSVVRLLRTYVPMGRWQVSLRTA